MRERIAVQLALRWGDTVVRAARVSPPAAFALGRGGDWELPEEALGAERFELLRCQEGAVTLAVPPRATAWVSETSDTPFRPSPLHALEVGTRASVQLGPLAIDIDVGRESGAPRRFGPFEGLAHQGVSAALHAVAFALLAMLAPPLNADVADVEVFRDRIAFLLHALNAGATAEVGHLRPLGDDDEPAPGRGGDARTAGGTGARAHGEEGSPGSSVGAAAAARVAIAARRDAPDPHLERERTLREAALFGMSLGALATRPSADPDAPTSPWGNHSSEGLDSSSALAPLWGTSIANAFAWGGLALTGTGEGGGGRADAIGLGEIAFGRGAGTGTNAAFGPGVGLGGIGEGAGGMGEGIAIGRFGSLGRGSGTGVGWGRCGDERGDCTGRGHVVKAPSMRCGGFEGRVSDGGCGARVSGRLPPEAIQRVVRANFGRFRLCYEHGLEARPTLRGRVATRFVIGRDGAVGVAVDDGSTLPDEKVVACVVRTFTALSFPRPEGGTVNVVYPLVFEPE